MGGPVPRCAAVQRHPDDPDAKLDILRRLHRRRGVRPSEEGRTLNLGVYAEVLRPGRVSIGDPIVPAELVLAQLPPAPAMPAESRQTAPPP
jgi:MOSC domain-containing protein YiiM